MLEEFDWPSLEQRRRTAPLGMLYKVSSGLAAVKRPLLKKQPQTTRRAHTSTFERMPCRADYRLNSFFPRTVRDWNTLPPETVSAPSIGAFISRVAKLQYTTTWRTLPVSTPLISHWLYDSTTVEDIRSMC